MRWVVAFAGLSGGLVVGTGAAAVARAIGLIVRLSAFAEKKLLRPLTYVMTAGMLFFPMAYLFGWTLQAPAALGGFAGLCGGIFVGMLACALAEMMDTLPVLGGRDAFWLRAVLLSVALGKVTFSFWNLVM